jgi:hypothetical protein
MVKFFFWIRFFGFFGENGYLGIGPLFFSGNFSQIMYNGLGGWVELGAFWIDLGYVMSKIASEKSEVIVLDCLNFFCKRFFGFFGRKWIPWVLGFSDRGGFLGIAGFEWVIGRVILLVWEILGDSKPALGLEG